MQCVKIGGIKRGYLKLFKIMQTNDYFKIV